MIVLGIIFPTATLLCRQQNLRLFGESSASPRIKKTTIFVQIIIIVGVADSGESGSKFIVASITRKNHDQTQNRGGLAA
jgi:hypothetical protein